MKFKKILTYSFGAIVLLSGLITTNALAKGDTKDTSYYLEMPKGLHFNAYTGSRTKYNDSSVYQKNSWIGKDRKIRLWIVNKDYEDVSGGRYVDVSSGQHKNVPNVANEKNHGKAIGVRIAGEVQGAPNTVVIAAKGVWSPDSRR
ncbi:hypothetical protein P4T89_10335 [Bacillus nakamurai]|uniref:DUF2712 domain-containing protein n=1 Tax=Bacillus nakamurai TaxID=1793963 RepID=A0A150F216_9BACI|nr:DUF2712 domain-containing protein [Bacillus nakamurai]KXZ13010.1 hypothetical protein AXI58_04830 [Bacillus nakamurai]MED1227971.1 hypothetical protein [Bacillus nakamurai]